MAVAQTKGHEEDTHTWMHEKNRTRKVKRKTKSRKQPTQASEQGNRIQGVSIARNFPVSATKPRRGPCRTICLLLPALVGNDIKCHCCRCRAPPRANKSTKTKQKRLDSGAVATQVPPISRTGTLSHDLLFHFCIRRQQYQYACPSLSPLPSLVITIGVLCCVA